MDKQQFLALIDKYLEGRASMEEEQMLLNYYGSFQHSRAWDEKVLGVKEEIERRMLGRIQDHVRKTRVKEPVRLWPRIAAAAAILLVAGAGLFFYTTYYVPRHPELSRHLDDRRDLLNDIKPGKNGATLTLANGEKIVLSDANNGELAKESDVTITKNADGELVYVISSGRSNENSLPAAEMMNTLTTARGETYQVRLPDGTSVWLNAASTLKYPASFVAHKNRRVELSGEGYFEVAKDKAHPFIVATDKQEVEVLGTHFNINSYADEPNTKTTLLEGSVRISAEPSSSDHATTPRHLESSRHLDDRRDLLNSKNKESLPAARDDGKGRDAVTLKPNQQAILANNTNITVKQVDPETAIAWKLGRFTYKNTPLDVVIRQISRWYDIDVNYTNDALKNELFSGSVSRYDKVSRILNTIEFTGVVKFKLKGRSLTITN
nr:FecR family protein [Pedobacter panaciterrae]